MAIISFNLRHTEALRLENAHYFKILGTPDHKTF